MTRALGVVRLSEVTDATTSPERQREVIEAFAKVRGSEIIGWADDQDVSASKVHPFKRPELSSWLNRKGEFDELLFWRLDRLVRGSFDWADMVRWADANGKILASATEPLDLGNKFGRMVANMIVGIAEMESDNTKERVLGAHAYLRQAGRFAGGKPPYGSKTVPALGGKGFTLIEDPETLPVLREAIDRVLAGEAVNAIIADFNRRGIASPQDSQRDKSAGQPWRAESLRRVLRNPAMLGHAVHKGKSVTGDDGMPVLRGLPLVTQSEYDRIQHALEKLARPGTGPYTRSQTPSLLLSVAYCLSCIGADGDAPLHRGTRGTWNRGPRIPHYICARANRPAQYGDRCKARSILTEMLEPIASEAFLQLCGEAEQMDRIWDAGEDHSEELATVRAALANVRDEYDRGGYAYQGGQADYDTRTGRLSARLAALSDLPSRAAAYHLRPTGKTMREAWEAASLAERRKLMVLAGFRVGAEKLDDGRLHLRLVIDPDLVRRAALATAGERDVPQWPPRPVSFTDVRQGVNLYVGPGKVAAMIQEIRDSLANRSAQSR
jgi:site-specific DNA recombinase